VSEKTVDYYFTVTSPWTYLGHDLLLTMARRREARGVHKPGNMAAVGQGPGGPPLDKRPVQRQHYRLIELQRWRAYRDRPLNLRPRYFPADATLANRMVLAAQQAGDDAGRLAGALMRAVWVEDRNVADPGTLKAIADAAGMDGARLLEAAGEPATEAEYRRLTEEAQARKVFGAPTYIYRDEPFWGQDRLEFLERALADESEPLRLP